MKHYNNCVIGIPKGEEREQEINNLFEEIVTEDIPSLVKKKDTQEQEAHRVPNNMDTNSTTQ